LDLIQGKKKQSKQIKKINAIEIKKKNFNISEVFEEFTSIINTVKFTEEMNYRYIIPANWLKHMMTQMEK
jgi:hypothetical protein